MLPSDWSRDEILPGYERLTLELPPDYDGPVVATLVRRRPAAPSGRAVLHVHGFVDYFFQAHVADRFVERGDAFYALDLRKHGRSLLPGQHPNFCKDVGEYEEDITAAIDRVVAETDGPVVAVGWSFGANVALRRTLEDARVGVLALVGFPLEHDLDIPPTPAVSELRALQRPVLLLTGEHDAYAPPARVHELASSLPDAQVEIVAGTDHYLWRHERDAARVVGAFVERAVGGQRGDG
jgi:alpha-beta hydrolase superfamily lysophospholipase